VGFHSAVFLVDAPLEDDDVKRAIRSFAPRLDIPFICSTIRRYEVNFWVGSPSLFRYLVRYLLKNGPTLAFNTYITCVKASRKRFSSFFTKRICLASDYLHIISAFAFGKQ
jgi:hypothetical protein